MNAPRITALIVAKNEAKELPECLAALQWVEQIVVVVDADSTDNTEAIARRLADTVIVREFDDFAAQRNAGLARARGDWILSVDADERVTPELRQEIEESLSKPRCPAAFRVPIRSTIFGRPFRYSGTQNDRPVRLFRRDAGWWTGRVHETVALNGDVDNLLHHLTHRTHESLNEFLIKLNHYTNLEARQVHASAVRPRRFDLTLRPLWTFLRLYVRHQGFRDGAPGFLFCVLSAVSMLVRAWKLRELCASETATVGHAVPEAKHGVREAA